MLGALPAVSRAQPAAVAPPQELLATGPAGGGGDVLWVARVSAQKPPAQGFETRLLYRRMNGTLAPLGGPFLGRAVSVAAQRDQLLVLFDDGTWIAASPTTRAVGRSLPVADAKLIALAADADVVWGVARAPAGTARTRPATVPAPFVAATSTAPATAPSTLPTTAPATTSPATVPTSAPATAAAATTRPFVAPAAPKPGEVLALFAYRRGAWEAVAEVPSDVAQTVDHVSLAVRDGSAVLLVRPSPDTVRVWRRDAADWTQVAAAAVPPNTRSAALVPGSPRLTVWVSPATDAEPDRLLVFDPPAATAPTTSTTNPAAGFPPPARSADVDGTANTARATRSAAFAFERFRSIRLAGDTYTEQAYDPRTLASAGPPAAATFESPGLPVYMYARYTVIGAALLLAIVASFRRRDQLRELAVDPSDLPLAPVGTRMLAGLVDAVPLLIGFYLQEAYLGTPTSVVDDYPPVPPVWRDVGFAAMLGWVLAFEVVAGRSAGKMIFGLRVVSVDGKPVTRMQLVTRNLMRVIDVGLSFFPLLLVPFSPLRQRIGDAAAGTLVVTDAAEEKKKGEDEGEESA